MTEAGLKRLFHKINRECYGGKLPNIKVTFGKTSPFVSNGKISYRSGGYFHPKTKMEWLRGEGHISLNPRWKKAKTANEPFWKSSASDAEGKSLMSLTEMMIHEMMHQYRGMLGIRRSHSPYYHKRVMKMCRQYGITDSLTKWYYVNNT